MRLFAGFCRVHLYQQLLYGKVLVGDQQSNSEPSHREYAEWHDQYDQLLLRSGKPGHPCQTSSTDHQEHADRFALWGCVRVAG